MKWLVVFAVRQTEEVEIEAATEEEAVGKAWKWFEEEPPIADWDVVGVSAVEGEEKLVAVTRADKLVERDDYDDDGQLLESGPACAYCGAWRGNTHLKGCKAVEGAK